MSVEVVIFIIDGSTGGDTDIKVVVTWQIRVARKDARKPRLACLWVFWLGTYQNFTLIRGACDEIFK